MNFNKPMPTKAKMSISLTILFIVLISFNQCVLKPRPIVNQSTTYNSKVVPPPSTNDTSTPPVTDPETIKVVPEILSEADVGIKNFEQINLTMSKLTGIPTSNTNVQTVYNDIAIQLPTDNNVKNFLSTNQVAITKLATEYCDRLVEIGTLKSTIWPAVNFSQTPNSTFTAANKLTIVAQNIAYFFGPLDTAENQQVSSELSTLFDTLLSGETLTSTTTTKKVMKGICTASLSSAYVTFL